MRIELVELYSELDEEFIVLEGLVDTGATLCIVPEHIRVWLGLPLEEHPRFFWQVRDPLVLKSTTIRLRIDESVHEVAAAVVDIPENFLRPAGPEELETRPLDAHPLTMRIILGDNLFSRLSSAERAQLGLL